MSDKRMKMRQRRQGYRLHQARLRGEKRGVSPVVATLILILIAVAAAAALYLWLVVWQGNLTKGIGQPGAQSTLSIGGSTSVYPFTSLAVSWFEQNNSDVVISDNQGGTGAGMVAVCAGNIDIGASSTPQTVSNLETSYGCSSTYASTIQIDTIAYDAVDVIVSSNNAHGLLSISADTLNGVYEAGSSTAGHYIGSINGIADGIVGITPVAGTALLWSQIPAFVPGYTFGVGALYSGAAPSTAAASNGAADVNVLNAAGGVACGTAPSPAAQNMICDDNLLFGAGAKGTPCGFDVCAGPFGTAATIVPISRSDASGTTQTFEARDLGYGTGGTSSSSSWAGASTPAQAQTDVGSFANLGYGGCGGNNLLSDCGWTYTSSEQGNGNPGVISAVSGNANSIGYASDGDARASGSGVTIVPFLGLGQGIEVNQGLPTVGYNGLYVASGTTYGYGGVIPTTGTSGTIAAGLTNSLSVNSYVGGRPFQLISLEPLTGVAQEFVTFITDPANNAALATATHEVGLYSVIP